MQFRRTACGLGEPHKIMQFRRTACGLGEPHKAWLNQEIFRKILKLSMTKNLDKPERKPEIESTLTEPTINSQSFQIKSLQSIIF